MQNVSKIQIFPLKNNQKLGDLNLVTDFPIRSDAAMQRSTMFESLHQVETREYISMRVKLARIAKPLASVGWN